MNTAQLFDGAKDFLTNLSLARIKRYLITDLTTQVQLQKLIALDIADDFEFILTSEEAGADKPSQQIFQIVAKQIPAGATVWMIGDNLEKDIIGAQKNLNAFGIWKDNGKSTDTALNRSVDAKFVNFKDLSKLIERIRRSQIDG